MASKITQLIPHHDRLIELLEDGVSLRKIADRLCVEGVDTDHNVVRRYCKKFGLTTKKKSPPVIKKVISESKFENHPSYQSAFESISSDVCSPFEAVEITSEIVTPEPPEKLPWQAPERLYKPLESGPWWDLHLPIVTFGCEDDSASWSLQDACEGVFITGSTGSGKTSGSGAMLAKTYLKSDFGGLVLTVKPDERQLWERYAEQCGRLDQLCIVEPGGKFRLNFLDYEARRPGMGSGQIENIVNLFYTILETYSRNQGDQSSSEFWDNAGKQLLRNILRVLDQALNEISLDVIGEFLSEAPKNKEEVQNGKWQNTEHFGRWLDWAIQRSRGTAHERVIDEAKRYWLKEFPALADKTRSCLVTGLTSMVDSFVEPAIHDLFCTDTTLTPEAVTEGAIILVDLPLKNYKSVGLFAQMIWKQLCQEAIERRSDAHDNTRRPVFLWADEAQFFYSTNDGLFQSTARSARCSTVYLTQNIANFYGLLGGSAAHDKVNGFLGNLNTKIFHCNNDPTTNQWASEQIGKHLTSRFSTSSSVSKKGLFDFFPSRNNSTSMQETLDYEIQPSEFTKLRTGSHKNCGLVDAIFVKSGTQFGNTGKHYFKATFQQEKQN